MKMGKFSKYLVFSLFQDQSDSICLQIVQSAAYAESYENGQIFTNTANLFVFLEMKRFKTLKITIVTFEHLFCSLHLHYKCKISKVILDYSILQCLQRESDKLYIAADFS